MRADVLSPQILVDINAVLFTACRQQAGAGVPAARLGGGNCYTSTLQAAKVRTCHPIEVNRPLAGRGARLKITQQQCASDAAVRRGAWCGMRRAKVLQRRHCPVSEAEIRVRIVHH
jgi:hypothetical protein